MYDVKTDDELRKELKQLRGNELILRNGQKNLIKSKSELMQQWRLIKDPVVKRELHVMISKLRSYIEYGRLQQELRWVQCEISGVQYQLHSHPSNQYGSIYENQLDLNYTRISEQGICGVKL